MNQFVSGITGEKNRSYPFDWTITPFQALRFVLGKDFDVQRILEFDNLLPNPTGSLTDAYTGVLHQHDFTRQSLEKLSFAGEANEKGVPLALRGSQLVEAARGRFTHTFQNLLQLKSSRGKMGFVRWMRFGHPDVVLPKVFEGETLDAIDDMLFEFLGHHDYCILHVQSKQIEDIEDHSRALRDVRVAENRMSLLLDERRGFNGDGTNDYRGDTSSWSAALDLFVREFGLAL